MKLLVATDLHYIPNLAEEIAVNAARLRADTYNHQVDGKLYWHNQLMVEQGEQLIDGLERIARQERPALLLFLGDMVNVNWVGSIGGVAARLKHFPCPVRQVLGNHDIYLDGEENRLQDAVTPGTFESGIRHEIVGEEGVRLGIIYIDLFVRSVGDGGEVSYRKWLHGSGEEVATGETKEYRPQDVAAAIALMEAAPDTKWLIVGHYPFVVVNQRVHAPGRKLMGDWPSAIPLADYLQQPNNLVGILCGHQHLAHFQAFAHGFHWHLPALVEYPCAAAILEWDGTTVQGRLLPVDEQIAAASLQERQESWPAGEEQDRHFVWSVGGQRTPL